MNQKLLVTLTKGANSVIKVGYFLSIVNWTDSRDSSLQE